jgi:hypothetical protein
LAERAYEAAKAVVPNPDRARHIAFDALRILYPKMPSPRLGFQLHYRRPDSASSIVQSAKRTNWWSDDHVDHVVGTLVAPEYGERAL